MTSSNDELRPESADGAAAETSPEPAAETESTPEPTVEMAAPAEDAPEESAAATVEATDTDAAPEATSADAGDAPAETSADAEAAMAAADPGAAPKKGQRVEVKLAQIGDDTCFLDYGGPSEGSIATTELKKDDGTLEYEVGAAFTAVVKSSGDEVVFTLGRKPMPENVKKLKEAFESKIPVEGTVKSTNKGGFEVNVGGARAFCPFSQIERGHCAEPEKYVGQKLPFLVTTFERQGRNIVVSHRKILEQEAAAAAESTRENLEVGAELDGVVRRLQPYGAFVDIGGLDGLVHVSQISHGHVGDPKDVLKVGEKVRVKVLRIEAPGTPKERISLSMKELLPDPWETLEQRFPVNSEVDGKVVRITDFGAFVEIEPGIDGLVHVSQLAEERIGHPSDVLAPGQAVKPRVLRIDVEQRRISLSLLPEGSERPQREYGGGGGGGGDRGRRPRREGGGGRDRGPREYTSSTPTNEKTPDVKNMDYDDALALLKQKFGGRE